MKIKKLAILITNDKGQGVTHIIILVPKKFLLAEMNKLFLPGLTPDWELLTIDPWGSQHRGIEMLSMSRIKAREVRFL